jgi:hypothetical protein
VKQYTCFISRSVLPEVNNDDFVFIKIFIHATVNNLCDIIMIGNSGQILRYVFCYNICNALFTST